MWTIVLAICYAPMTANLPPRCQQLTERNVTLYHTEEACTDTFGAHENAVRQELARQGLRLVMFGAKCIQSGDPA